MEPRGSRTYDALFGTTDTWVRWNLNRRPRGVHVTDNQRQPTMLMDLETLDWGRRVVVAPADTRAMPPRDRIVGAVGACRCHASTRPVGGEVLITGLGDQHAAMVGRSTGPQGGEKHLWDLRCWNHGETIVRIE